MTKLLNLIVACAENRVIGRDGKLPWRIPEDLNFFHAETAGQICVLGRVCYDSWPRVRLYGRRPVVLTSRPLADARSYAERRNAPEANNPNRTEPRSFERERVESDPIAVRSLPEALAVAEELP